MMLKRKGAVEGYAEKVRVWIELSGVLRIQRES